MNIINDTSNTKTNLKQTSSTTSKSTVENSKSGSSAKQTELEPKQIIKGEIVDIRANEISIKLPSSEVITAKMASSAEFYIGQFVTFTIEEISDKKIYVKPMTDATVQNQNPTILKALIAAGLPANDKNIAIVNELLKNQMPIDKQTITKLLHQTLTYNNASLETLVSMNKSNIPLSENNITQFENYKNHEHKIIHEIENLSNDLSTLMSKLSENTDSEELFSLNQKLLSIILKKEPDNTMIHNEAELITSENKSGESNESSIVQSDKSDKFTSENTQNNFTDKSNNIINSNQINSISDVTESNITENKMTLNTLNTENMQLNLSKEDRISLVRILDTLNLPDTLKESILDGTASLKEIYQIIHQGKELAYEQNSPELIKHFNDPLINEITNLYNNSQSSDNELRTFMSQENRITLATTLESLNIPPDLKEQIIQGSATSNQILNFLQNNMKAGDKEIIKHLLNSREYKQLLKEEMNNQWTLTPKSITKEKEVETFYNKIYKQLEDISTYIKETGLQENSLVRSTNNLKDNLDFMKTLNEMFSYVQLPVKLKDKNIHSDLYVYTNKKALKKNGKNISALLHLDMDYLGGIDIHINLNSNNITTKFYLEDKESQTILKDNMINLKEALQNKGFTLNSEVLTREKDIDIVSDFIEQGSSSSSLTRYSFDVRA